MDRQIRNLILLFSALVCFTASALAQSSLKLREASWLAPDGQISVLTREPRMDREQIFAAAASSALVSQYPDLEALRSDIELGEHLFKNPHLLGGQAAKAGLSCNSCHVNGRSNPAFMFPAISGQPGTADTTHNFFSETLGNGVFDPVPIPDLTQPGKVSHELESRELEGFLETIVIEEFGGAQPTPGVIEALSTYVRALQMSGQSPVVQYHERSIARDLGDAKATIEHAASRLDQGDVALSHLLIAGARDRLALIHERLIAGEHDAQRGWLVDRSRELGAAQSLLRDERSVTSDCQNAILSSLSEWDQMPDFVTIENSTYYDSNNLTASTVPSQTSFRESSAENLADDRSINGVSRIAA